MRRTPPTARNRADRLRVPAGADDPGTGRGRRRGDRQLYELGDLAKAEYRNRKNDLLIERDQLEAQPAAASITLQRQRLESIVDVWSVMADEERSASCR